MQMIFININSDLLFFVVCFFNSFFHKFFRFYSPLSSFSSLQFLHILSSSYPPIPTPTFSHILSSLPSSTLEATICCRCQVWQRLIVVFGSRDVIFIRLDSRDYYLLSLSGLTTTHSSFRE